MVTTNWGSVLLSLSFCLDQAPGDYYRGMPSVIIIIQVVNAYPTWTSGSCLLSTRSMHTITHHRASMTSHDLHLLFYFVSSQELVVGYIHLPFWQITTILLISPVFLISLTFEECRLFHTNIRFHFAGLTGRRTIILVYFPYHHGCNTNIPWVS